VLAADVVEDAVVGLEDDSQHPVDGSAVDDADG
jgi:hypothetical protein